MEITQKRESAGHIQKPAIWVSLKITIASLVAQIVKNLPAMQKTQVRSPSQEGPWRRKWQPTPVILPEEFHGQAIGYLQSMGFQRVGHD